MKKKIDKNQYIEALDFLKKNWRYFAAALVFILMVVILANCTGPDRKTAFTDSTEEVSPEDFTLDADFEVDAYEELNNLVNSYFSAYASGDTTTLETFAYPLTDNEMSYINVCSQYFEGYQNVTCYTKHGLTTGSYFVSAYYELKFYGVDTPAPGLAFFYVETDADGNLYLNNSFCAYNRERMETEMDDDVYQLYILYGQQADVASLREEVQQKYQEALNSDSALVTMLSSTFPTAIDEWRRGLASVESAEESETEAVAETEAPADGEATAEGEAVAEGETTAETEATAGVSADLKMEYGGTAPSRVIYVTVKGASVNVRAKASTSGKLLGKAKAGETYVKTGTDGDWTIIDFKGNTGYIMTEYLE